MRTVELTVDERLDRRVRDAWARLAAADLPSQAHHPHPTNRPHLTVAAVADFPPGAAVALAEALAGLPVAAVLDGVLRFDGRAGVLAWRVVADEPLLDLHRRVWSALGAAAGRNPLHAPGFWVPHVTLARRLPADREPAALAALAGLVTATGSFPAARSYDSISRTVTELVK